ncbi:BrnA antitoxin family protein [Pararhodospirillum oryzae]|nr:BrnA antitoxin family protein [Pararhodospirillum oryzae]
MTDEEIDRAMASDPDAAPVLDDNWFANAERVPSGKTRISIRLDPDILSFFKQGGPHYQTRINAVLRAYMEARQAKATGG